MEKGLGTCKLCGNYKKLIKAHIIPNWMYKPVLGPEKKMYVFSIGEDHKKAKRVFTGEYETGLLCSECDSKIGIYDDYVCKVFNGGVKLSVKTSRITAEDILHDFKDLDYTKFKLFILSLLWRSSISQRDFFQDIRLSEDFKKELREKLILELPGNDSYLPCSIIVVKGTGRIEVGQLMLQPYTTSNTHTFFVSGYIFTIYEEDNSALSKDFSLKEDGSIRILSLGESNSRRTLIEKFNLDWLFP